MHIRKYRAFGLVEILVVVAIIGMLSLVAVPAYKDYVIRAKVGATLPIMDKFIRESILWYERYGEFPTITQMGYPQGNNEYNIANPENFISYASHIVVFSECDGQKANVSVRFNTSDLGINGEMNVMYRLRPPGSGGDQTYEILCFYHELDTVHTEENTKYLPPSCQHEWVYGCF